MSERIAFRLNLNPGEAVEYEKRHDDLVCRRQRETA